jgi:HEAT repeat protein
MPTNDELEDILNRLSDAKSPKRRSAAKKLRKLGDPRACPRLVEALEREVADERTWETQYQLIMAVGSCKCTDAVPLIRELAAQHVESTMRQVAVGDTLVSLALETDRSAAPVILALTLGRTYEVLLAHGAMRAVAMQRRTFDEEEIQWILGFVRDLSDHGVTFWTAAACAGWSGEIIERFLRTCVASDDAALRAVAENSLRGVYGTFKPL